MNDSPHTNDIQTRPRADSSQEPFNQGLNPNAAPPEIISPADITPHNQFFFAHNDDLEPQNVSEASTTSSKGDQDAQAGPTKQEYSEQNLKKFYNIKITLVILTWLGIIAVVAYSFVTYIAPSTSQGKAAQFAMTQLGKVMSLNPLTEIYTSDKKSCKQGYEKIDIGTWPGSKDYCRCKFPVTPNMMYECPVQAGCNYFSPIPSKPITIWRNNVFCGKRNSKFEYTATQSCSRDLKLCNDYYCIPKDENCPITSIKFNVTSNQDIQDSLIIELIKDAKSTPIVGFTLDTLGKACFGSGILHERKDDFKSISGRWRNCSYYGVDPGAKIVDRKNELAVYKQNNFQNILDLLMGYKETIENHTLFLNSLSHYPMRISSACMDKDLFKYSDIFISEFNLRTSTQAMFVIIFFSISIMSCTCFCCSCLVTRGDEFNFKNRTNVINNICQILLAFGAAVIFGLAIEKLAVFKHQDENYNFLAKQKCFLDSKINDLLLDFHEMQAPLYLTFWIPSLIVVLLSVFIAILSFAELVKIIKMYCNDE